MPTDILPFAFEIRTAKTGKFYVAARNTVYKQLWAHWVFYTVESAARMAMYELELARVGRTWNGPDSVAWKVINGPK